MLVMQLWWRDKTWGCIQKFPDWPPGTRTANGTALCHQVQLYCYFVSQSIEFCRHNPLCCFSTSVYFCKRILLYGLSPETFGCTIVSQNFGDKYFGQRVHGTLRKRLQDNIQMDLRGCILDRSGSGSCPKASVDITDIGFSGSASGSSVLLLENVTSLHTLRVL
jgi:hypothetical protein